MDHYPLRYNIVACPVVLCSINRLKIDNSSAILKVTETYLCRHLKSTNEVVVEQSFSKLPT